MNLPKDKVFENFTFDYTVYYHGFQKRIIVFPAYVSDTVVVLHYYDKENKVWSKLDLYPIYKEDMIEILSKEPEVKGVVHCFTGSVQEAQKYIEMGFLIGINGIIFKLDLNEVVKSVPLDKMVFETDCPYLTPSPEAGKRNEPMFIKHTISKVAELKGVSFEEVAEKTTENARNLFKI